MTDLDRLDMAESDFHHFAVAAEGAANERAAVRDGDAARSMLRPTEGGQISQAESVALAVFVAETRTRCLRAAVEGWPDGQNWVDWCNAEWAKVEAASVATNQGVGS